MNNNEHLIPIPGRLHSVATEGHVSGADEIYDDTQQKNQATINSELIEAVGTGGSVDTRITNAVNVEKTRAEGAESTLDSKITAEQTRATSTENALDNRVDTLEEAVGTGGSVDSRITSAVATETSRAQEAESTLQNGITTEATRAQETETELDNRVSTNESNIEALQEAYRAITQSQLIPKTSEEWAAMTSWEEGVVYRVQGTTSYADYMYNGTTIIKMAEYNNAIDNEPTAGSDNLVKSGGVQEELALGAVYDVSAKNPTAGVNNDGKWESLSALLSDTNLSTLIPTPVRKGGMSIKFVRSSDNKYVQYFLNKNEWSTNETDWENLKEEVVQLGQNTDELSQEVKYIVGNLVELNSAANIIKLSFKKGVKYNFNVTGKVGNITLANSSTWKTEVVDSVEKTIENTTIEITPSADAAYLHSWGISETAQIVIKNADAIPSANEIPYKESNVDETLDVSTDKIDRLEEFSATIGMDIVLAKKDDFVNGMWYDTNTFRTDGNYGKVRSAFMYPLCDFKLELNTDDYSDYCHTVTLFDKDKKFLQNTLLLQRFDSKEFKWTADGAKQINPNSEYFGVFVCKYVDETYYDIDDVEYQLVKDSHMSLIEDISNIRKSIGLEENLLLDNTIFVNGMWANGNWREDGTYGYAKSNRAIIDIDNVVIQINSSNDTSKVVYGVATFDGNNNFIGNTLISETIENNKGYLFKDRILKIVPSARKMSINVHMIDNTELPSDISIVVSANYTDIIDYSQRFNKTNRQIVVVDACGNGDYTSLQDAINDTSDKNNGVPKTIIVKPGTYYMDNMTESTRSIASYRNLSIIGTNKNNCIIRNDNGYYDTSDYVDAAPLKLAGNCAIENLTIISTAINSEYEASKNKSYCVHLDFFAKEGDRLTVRNCRMINDHNCCIGIGLHNKYTIEISNCELESTNTNGNGWGAIIAHEGSDKGDCSLILRNNIIIDNSNNGITLAHSYNGKIKLVLNNNTIVNNGKPITIDCNYHIISASSFGNNRPEMNYIQDKDIKYSTIVQKPFDFNGKKALFCGDSITYGFTSGSTNVHGTSDFPKLFSDFVGLTYINAGVAGATLCEKIGYGYIKQQLIDNSNDDFDFIFIAGGVNDWQLGISLTDVKESVEDYINYINDTFPSAKVIWITPINQAGYELNHSEINDVVVATLQEYRNVISRAVLEDNTTINQSVIQGDDFNFPDKNDASEYINLMFGDRLHPTELGYKKLYLNGLRNALL